MPQKLNKAGNVQNYVPAGNGDVSGEYGDNVDGSNRHFTAFKKPEDEGKKKEFKQPDKKRTLYFEKHPSYKYYGIEDGYSLIDKKRYERFKDSANRAKNKYTYETKDVEWNDQEIKDDLKKSNGKAYQRR